MTERINTQLKTDLGIFPGSVFLCSRGAMLPRHAFAAFAKKGRTVMGGSLFVFMNRLFLQDWVIEDQRWKGLS